jgi:hypothetical protein
VISGKNDPMANDHGAIEYSDRLASHLHDAFSAIPVAAAIDIV